MVRDVALGETGVVTSALAFGCADLFREPSSARRRRLLEVALELGIRHFDTAPMYGLGLAESELGRFAVGKRDRLVLATKFGIAPSAAARALGRVQGSIRRLAALLPGERGNGKGDGDPRTGAVGALLYRASGYGPAAARAGLEQSLRALRTGHVDLLLLHDPFPGEVRSDEVRGFLESAREQGTIRAWGVAGEPGSVLDAARKLGPAVPVVQLRGDVFQRSLQHLPAGTAEATVLFGAIGRALPRILARLRSDQLMQQRWRDALGAEATRERLASLLIRDALDMNGGGPVLFSTVRPERIAAAAKAAESTTPTVELAAFRRLLEDESGASEPAS